MHYINLLMQAVDLAAKPDDNFPELARTLRRLQDIDKNSLRAVVEIGELGLRKAYYLAEIDRRVGHLGISPDRMRMIGWTKMHLLSKHLNALNCDELLDLGEALSVHDLRIKLEGGEPDTGRRCVLLYLSAEQYSVFEAATLKHGWSATGENPSTREEALISALSDVWASKKPPAK